MHNYINEICQKLRLLLEEAVKRNLSEGVLLSGGLDTSALVALASKYTPLKAFTVAFDGASAPDINYAKLVADHFGLKHSVQTFGEDDLYKAIPLVVKKLESFDPMEIRNSLTIFIGLKAAREKGVSSIMTGDGCDELFAGYSFLFGLEKEKLHFELQRLWKVMRFSSVDLAYLLGMEVKLPYLDSEFKEFAMEIDPELKVQVERGQTWGKWIIRKAFENILPEEIVWRAKTPIEVGSGTATLTTIFNSIISDVYFREKMEKYLDEDKVTIRDKEQLFYYEVYRRTVGVPHPKDIAGKICPYCNSTLPLISSYCRTCGAYPI